MVKNRIGMEKDISGCSVFGILNLQSKPFSGGRVAEGISVMRDRANGLGAGFAGYGIYPDFPEHFALHLLYDSQAAKRQTEEYLESIFKVDLNEPIPVSAGRLHCPQLLWRYFVRVRPNLLPFLSEEEQVVASVMKINSETEGAFVISSGKNLGVFKGVGWPEEIAEFFRLDEYSGYMWLGHGRFPTNSSGWWGGAHPFNLLNWSVVHNGEISSYGVNRRYLENFGYSCCLATDTEVITYLTDLLVRRHQIPLAKLGAILAAPLWSEIDIKSEEERKECERMRIIYGAALLNGPFSIIVGFNGGMFGLIDRVKLRPMVAAKSPDYFYLSSEEAAVRKLEPQIAELWHPEGGELVLAQAIKAMKP